MYIELASADGFVKQRVSERGEVSFLSMIVNGYKKGI